MNILPNSSSHNLEIFVKTHVQPGTTTVADKWTGYNFLDNNDNFTWHHEVYNYIIMVLEI